MRTMESCPPTTPSTYGEVDAGGGGVETVRAQLKSHPQRNPEES